MKTSLIRPHQKNGQFSKSLREGPRRIKSIPISSILHSKYVRDNLEKDVVLITNNGIPSFITIPIDFFMDSGGLKFLETHGFDIESLQRDYELALLRKLTKDDLSGV